MATLEDLQVAGLSHGDYPFAKTGNSRNSDEDDSLQHRFGIAPKDARML